MSRLPLTVPLELWHAVSSATTPEFADSYLSGAEAIGAVLIPPTGIAFDRLAKSAARDVIEAAGYRLARPSASDDPRAGNGRASPAEAWRPLSDAEYDALPLSGKIRHHRILANQAGLKAGPQTRAKRPVPAEDMPSSWRQWRERSAHHHAEARRLSEIMQRARDPMRAAAE